MKYRHKKTGDIAYPFTVNAGQGDYTTDKGGIIPKRFIEDSCDWEKVEELEVPIGTKFKHERDNHTIYTINGVENGLLLISWINDNNTNDSTNRFRITVANAYFKSGTWIKYEEKEWEILEIKVDKTIYKRDDEGFKSPVGLFIYTEEHCLNSKNAKITSIKRLSDGEVFKIEDYVEHLDIKDRGKITSINLVSDTIYFSTDYCSHVMGTRFDNSKKLKLLFTTSDGVDIFEGDEYFYIYNWEVNSRKAGDGKYLPFIDYYYSTEEAAQNYIECNKPCLSFNDVWNMASHTTNSSKVILKKELQDLVKSKL